MRSNKPPVPLFIPAAACLLLALGVATVFTACSPKDDGSWMHCHDVQLAIIACSAIATVVFAAAAFLKDNAAGTALFVLGALICVIALLLPSIMPMCMDSAMRCHAVMAPFAHIMATLGSIMGIVSAVLTYRERTKNLPRYGRL